jgi:hypothetical protein
MKILLKEIKQDEMKFKIDYMLEKASELYNEK